MSKVTLEAFATRLSTYKTGAAARKAIGRFNGWSDKEKQHGRALVDAHFGASEYSPATCFPPISVVQPQVRREELPAPLLFAGSEEEKRAAQSLERQRAIERTIGYCATAVETLKKANDICPSINLLPYVKELVEAHNSAIRFFAEDLSQYVCAPVSDFQEAEAEVPAEAEVEAEAASVEVESSVEEDLGEEDEIVVEAPKAKRKSRSRKNGKSTADLSL